MLEITVNRQELHFFNERKNEFVDIIIPEAKLKLEHSLISLQRWESKWHIPYFGEKPKTREQICDYIRCMTISSSVNPVDPNIYNYMTAENLKIITDYIEDKNTAAWFNDKLIGAQKKSSEMVTAEIIYYWMVSLNIPIEFEKRHLNFLLTLIKVVSIKNQPEQKKDPKLAALERDALNRKRRAMLNSSG